MNKKTAFSVGVKLYPNLVFKMEFNVINVLNVAEFSREEFALKQIHFGENMLMANKRMHNLPLSIIAL